jgi:hypothetical protein
MIELVNPLGIATITMTLVAPATPLIGTIIDPDTQTIITDIRGFG